MSSKYGKDIKIKIEFLLIITASGIYKSNEMYIRHT